jgi:hypothetical protein
MLQAIEGVMLISRPPKGLAAGQRPYPRTYSRIIRANLRKKLVEELAVCCGLSTATSVITLECKRGAATQR